LPRWHFALLAVIVAIASFGLLEPSTAFVACGFGLVMAAIALYDAAYFIVPDRLSLPAIPAGLLVSGWLAAEGERHTVMFEHVLAALIGALSLLAVRRGYAMLRGREGLGLGDVKLAGVAGAWTGLAGLSPVLLLACLGAITAVLVMAARGKQAVSGTTPVPFGAALAPAIWLVWLAQAGQLPLTDAFLTALWAI
jgi:leader peptidase (prepilin peptidase)/N-methyltransferase